MVVLLAQTSRYLADPSVLHHDKLKLKKELANELVRLQVVIEYCDHLLRIYIATPTPLKSEGLGTRPLRYVVLHIAIQFNGKRQVLQLHRLCLVGGRGCLDLGSPDKWKSWECNLICIKMVLSLAIKTYTTILRFGHSLSAIL